MAPSTEVLIGDQDGDHVLIRPLSRTHPGLFDYSDANWIVCDVDIAAGGFRGSFRADLRSEEFQPFLQQIDALMATMDGAAGFTTMEGQVAVSLVGDGKGRIRVAGEAVDVAGTGNRLQFGFDIDQTYLPEIARSLGYLLAAFPVIGTPGMMNAE